jgi:cytochrome oxidase Cu insertion factor (SCO1/SenC/PrrC family)
MQSLAANPEQARKRNRRTLWLLFAVCAAPVIASYIAYNFWRPASHVNYGTLLEPHPLPDASFVALDGKVFRLSHLKGEWVLLTSASAACDAACRERLVYMRQVRLAQGKESERIERVWIVTDERAPSAELLAEHTGLHVVRDPRKTVLAALPPSGSGTEHVYVVDPLGNLMMRFPADPDPRRMLKDISRLLRHSKWK